MTYRNLTLKSLGQLCKFQNLADAHCLLFSPRVSWFGEDDDCGPVKLAKTKGVPDLLTLFLIEGIDLDDGATQYSFVLARLQ